MKKRLTDKLTKYIGIINIMLILVIIKFLINLNIFPFKYIVLLVLFLIIYFIITVGITLFKNRPLRIIGCILTGILFIITCISIKYSNNTSHFLNKYFSNLGNHYENKYYVIVKNEYNDVSELNNKVIGYFINTPKYEDALSTLDLSFEKREYDSVDLMINDLKNGTIDAFLIEDSLYYYIKENNDSINLDNYKILSSFILKIKDENLKNSNEVNTYNIYIGGLDFTEKYTDFNMIVSINKNNHKILLTSIPRDYYVDIYGKDGKDLLGYAGVWGISTSVKTVENLFGINIDYFLRIHTTNLVDLVDALGGVEFCSDYSFTTTHALILGSYDDTTGKHLTVQSGCHEYSGIEILTIARERLQVGGDRVRQKHCQDIIISIFKKMLTTNTLSNYDKILNSLGNSYTTNVSKKVVQALIKDIINNPSSWEFIRQSVDGTSSMGKVHFSNYTDHIMIPDMSTVEVATNKINEVLGKL